MTLRWLEVLARCTRINGDNVVELVWFKIWKISYISLRRKELSRITICLWSAEELGGKLTAWLPAASPAFWGLICADHAFFTEEVTGLCCGTVAHCCCPCSRVKGFCVLQTLHMLLTVLSVAQNRVNTGSCVTRLAHRRVRENSDSQNFWESLNAMGILVFTIVLARTVYYENGEKNQDQSKFPLKTMAFENTL